MVQSWDKRPLPGKHRQLSVPETIPLQRRKQFIFPQLLHSFLVVHPRGIPNHVCRIGFAKQSAHRRIRVGNTAIQVSHAESLRGGLGKLVEDGQLVVGLLQFRRAFFNPPLKFIVGLLQCPLGTLPLRNVLDHADQGHRSAFGVVHQRGRQLPPDGLPILADKSLVNCE